MQKSSIRILTLLFTLLMGLSAFSATYYVAPNGSASNPGTENSPWSLAKANSSLQAGDVAYLKGGDYEGEPIQPANSGNASNYITYAAASGETPVITDIDENYSEYGFLLGSYIKLYQITVDGKQIYPNNNVKKAGRINGDYCIIEACTFKHFEGYGVLRIGDGAEYNQIIYSRFDFGGHCWDESVGSDHGDMLSISGDYTLIEGNHLTHGGHNLLRLNASYCVIRRNVFDNDWSDVLSGEKGARSVELNYHEAGEVYNLFELNVVKGTRPSIDPDGQMPTALKAVGEGNIIRRNFFTDNSDHCMQTNRRVASSKDLKIYGNVFYNNGGAAAYGETEISDYSYKNNIIYKNRQDPYNDDNDNEIWLDQNLDDHIFHGNAFIKSTSGDARLDFKDTGRKSISQLEASYPNNFKSNIEQAPQFVVSDPQDLEDVAQASGSPCIDAGVFLTVTSGSGSGTTMTVDDAGYFSDGFGITDGDTIQIEGQTQTAIVTNVNYSTNTLTLDTSLSWQSGKGVSLKYSGSKPDIGVYEYDGTVTGSEWENISLSENQTDVFTITFEATPDRNPLDCVMGLSNGPATHWDSLAAICRFDSSSGNIDARNGGSYAADQVISYSANTLYEFRMDVNISQKKYSAFVTPENGTEYTIGTNFNFRTEQAGVSQLNNLSVRVGTDSGDVDIDSMTVSQSPPVISSISANPDTVILPASTQVTAVADDPYGQSLSYSWSKISGPGSVSFGNSNSDSTSVSFGTDGNYSLRVTVSSGIDSVYDDISITVTVADTSQSAYGDTVRAIPGRIEAEHYDEGGEGVAYHDGTTGNTGGDLRTDDVDIEATADVGGGYNVGWFTSGEWLEYTVNVADSGTYDLDVRVGTKDPNRTFYIELNGSNITGNIAVPQFEDWSTFGTVTVSDISLPAGQHVLRVVMGPNDGMNFNWMEFSTTDVFEGQAQAGGAWVNIPLSEDQTEAITFTFEAIPDRSPLDCVMGLSNGPASHWDSLATICRFDTSGNIDARNGGSYAADQEIPYSGNTRYAFRMEVNIPQKKYSAFVTPEYGTEDTIATNFNFRTSQADVNQLNNLGLYMTSDSGAVDIYNMSVSQSQSQSPPVISSISANPDTVILPDSIQVTVTATDADQDSLVFSWEKISGPGSATFANADTASTSVSFSAAGSYDLRVTVSDGQDSTSSDLSIIVQAHAQAGGPWVNISLPEDHTDEFTFTFEAICDRSPMDCAMGLSNGPASHWDSLATICRFDTSGNIDARNGGSYAADQEIPYSGNTRYAFRMEVNIPQKKYSAFVTPEYGTEDTIATNFNFRTEQSGVSQLNNLGFYVHSDSGAVDIHPTYALSKARQVSLNDPGSIILPKGFEMLPNYPNPFNPSTTIAYTLPEPAAVTITVYNVLGQIIDRLLVRQQQAPGNYKIQWSPGNSAHSINNSGVYILKLTALGQSGAQYNHSQKMLFLK